MVKKIFTAIGFGVTGLFGIYAGINIATYVADCIKTDKIAQRLDKARARAYV